MFQNLYNTYVKNGIGVIISEWGSVDRNVNGRDQARVNHAYYYMKTATDYDIACFVWDNGAVSGDNHEEAFGFLNKHKASGLYDDMVKKAMSIMKTKFYGIMKIFFHLFLKDIKQELQFCSSFCFYSFAWK